MSNYTYNKILERAKTCQSTVKKSYKTGISWWWSYYFAKVIWNGKKSFPVKKIKDASKPTGTTISREISKTDYKDMAARLIKYVDQHGTMPNYITYKSYKITPRLFCEVLSRVVIYNDKNKALPNYVSCSSKVFNKPVKGDDVFQYFVKKFGNVTTIDGALGKIAGKGYGYYYDDKYTNKETIDRMKSGKGVNCTDSTHVFYHIGKALGYDVRCLHVRCSGGDGHVRLQFRHSKHTGGEWINRDPAAVLSSGSVTYNWCTSGYTLLAINPSWWVAQLNK